MEWLLLKQSFAGINIGVSALKLDLPYMAHVNLYRKLPSELIETLTDWMNWPSAMRGWLRLLNCWPKAERRWWKKSKQLSIEVSPPEQEKNVQG
jgi:hypothetical protein